MLRRSLAAILLLAAAADAGAQVDPPYAAGTGSSAASWANEAPYAIVNALIGALTAGLGRGIRGGDDEFTAGFWRGALGGTVAYAGRRIAVERFHGAGLLGRQVAAVGASVVRNAAERRGSLDRLLLPVGPVHFYFVRSDGARRLRVKVDAVAAVVGGTLLLRGDAHVDWGASVSAGTLVFRSPRPLWSGHTERFAGQTVGGTVILRGRPHHRSDSFAHERVHVLQTDFAFQVWGGPLEGWLASKNAVARALYRYVDFDLVAPLVNAGLYRGLGVDYASRPHEVEADFLEGR